MQKVSVKLGSRGHNILISSGFLDELGDLAREPLGEKCRQAILISNPTVASIYGARSARSLRRAGFKVRSFSIADGERFKTLRTAESLFGFLIEHGVERSDVIIALGGGVVGDIAGFVAAIYLRGIRYVQVPTTLLSQIDSSVGGKTAVNHALGKNLIGAFYQPALVVIDPGVLGTLPARQIGAGLYEAIKYGVILDRQLFDRISYNIDRLKSLQSSELEHLIARCCLLKAGVVERDEREGGLRRILNFGHTVGHALEAVSRYRRFLHGEAVGHGMLAASSIAERLDLLTQRDRERIGATIASAGDLPSAKTLALDDIISAIHHDKKVEAGRATFVLPVRIGKVVMRCDVPPAVIRAALKDALK